MLNESLSLSIQMFVAKANRVSKSQKLFVNFDLDSFLTVNIDTGINEMAKALDVLSDLAKANPEKALGYVGSFASVINNKADTNSVKYFNLINATVISG